MTPNPSLFDSRSGPVVSLLERLEVVEAEAVLVPPVVPLDILDVVVELVEFADVYLYFLP